MPKVKLFDIDKAKSAAKETFWNKGFNATSMQDLVDAMQISRQSLYDTFGNKNELFEACLADYQKEAFENTCKSLTYDKPVKQVFESFYNDLIESIVTDSKNKSCFILNSLMETIPGEIAVDNVVHENYEQLAKKIKDILLAAKKKEHLNFQFTLDALTNHIIMTIHGIKVVGKINKDKVFLKNLAKTSLVVFG
jgi:TetR/AcrR family transcriptional regulator, transcriptional repressor for nem operon